MYHFKACAFKPWPPSCSCSFHLEACRVLNNKELLFSSALSTGLPKCSFTNFKSVWCSWFPNLLQCSFNGSNASQYLFFKFSWFDHPSHPVVPVRKYFCILNDNFSRHMNRIISSDDSLHDARSFCSPELGQCLKYALKSEWFSVQNCFDLFGSEANSGASSGWTHNDIFSKSCNPLFQADRNCPSGQVCSCFFQQRWFFPAWSISAPAISAPGLVDPSYKRQNHVRPSSRLQRSSSPVSITIVRISAPYQYYSKFDYPLSKVVNQFQPYVIAFCHMMWLSSNWEELSWNSKRNWPSLPVADASP